MTHIARCALAGALLVGPMLSSHATAQPGAAIVGLGDSIGQGVQSGDASVASQPFSYLNLIAWRMGASFPLPLIRTNPFGAVGDTSGRSRIDASVRGFNLAVSGADVRSLLFDRATAATEAQIDTETELVLYPEIGSQMEVAERLRPALAVCWIGNNDALGAALAFDRLNGTQLTPVHEFELHFREIVQRLAATGARAVFGTIPDVTDIAFLLDRQDLIRLLGSPHGLPEGSLTTLTAAVLVRVGLASPLVFSNADYVLDPAEQQVISAHIQQLNAIIKATVAAHGMALVDTHAIFAAISKQPIELFGVPLTTRFLGGLFSLDGVHPSNVGQAVLAHVFIDALNRHYGMDIPPIDGLTWFWLLATDPFVDKDGDGRVVGRWGAGLLETVLSLLQISGDQDDGTLPFPTVQGTSSSTGAPGERTPKP